MWYIRFIKNLDIYFWIFTAFLMLQIHISVVHFETVLIHTNKEDNIMKENCKTVSKQLFPDEQNLNQTQIQKFEDQLRNRLHSMRNERMRILNPEPQKQDFENTKTLLNRWKRMETLEKKHLKPSMKSLNTTIFRLSKMQYEKVHWAILW